VLGQAAGFLAVGAIQPQQLGDLIQAEAQPLGDFTAPALHPSRHSGECCRKACPVRSKPLR
jgi:hypothetical protein